MKQAHQRFDDCSKIITKQRNRLQASRKNRNKKYIYLTKLYVVAWNRNSPKFDGKSVVTDLGNKTSASLLGSCPLRRRPADEECCLIIVPRKAPTSRISLYFHRPPLQSFSGLSSQPQAVLTTGCTCPGQGVSPHSRRGIQLSKTNPFQIT